MSKKEVAFKEFILCPEVVGDICSADVGFKSPYGNIKSSWGINGHEFTYKVKVPVNTRALVSLPTKDVEKVLEGKKKLSEHSGIFFKGVKDGRCICEIGSGEYEFTILSFE